MRPRNYDHFCYAAAQACEAADRDLTSLFMVDDDEEGLAVVGVSEPTDLTPTLDQMFAGLHLYGGMAMQIPFSPDERAFEDHWLLICVHKGEPARFFVSMRHPPTYPPKWTQLENDTLPWIALSTAGGLRKALDSQPMTLRASKDPRLFNRVDEEPPPVHPDGKI